jgi:hypothetical protein
MKIKILRGTNVDGKSMAVGETYEVNKDAAATLIRLKKAVAVTVTPESIKPKKEPYQKPETKYKTPSGKTVKVTNKRKGAKR